MAKKKDRRRTAVTKMIPTISVPKLLVSNPERLFPINGMKIQQLVSIPTKYAKFLYSKFFLSIKNGSVWRIRDVYPGSRILVFTHPGSRIKKQQ
jgi:hypothetical protein